MYERFIIGHDGTATSWHVSRLASDGTPVVVADGFASMMAAHRIANQWQRAR